MRSSQAETNGDLLNRIEAIEQDVRALKLTILKKMHPQGKKPISLRGVLKGIEITDHDIKLARKSLYGKIGI
jgi:hypothetical protein